MPLSQENENIFLTETLTHDELEAIKYALEQPSPWDHENFVQPHKNNIISAKNKIKALHRSIQNDKCCYCQRSLNDANVEIDREHVIPKSSKTKLCYEIFNISIACKRCNMTYKKDSTQHLSDLQGIERDFRNEQRYLIPHPNIDNIEDHLFRISVQLGPNEITAYRILSPKGEFLFDFVGLEELCVDQLDVAQGLKAKNEEIIAKLETRLGIKT